MSSLPIDLSGEVVLRWNAPTPEHVPLFTEGGITVVWLTKRDGQMDTACAAAGIRVAGPGDVRLLKPEQLESAGDRTTVVLKDGVWSGAGPLPARETVIAGATRRPWVEANGFRIGYFRALYPGLRPVLGYQMDAEAGVKPDKPPALSRLELALIDAWAAGGNYVLSLTAEHQHALISGQPEARAAWRALGRTARWLRGNIALFRQQAFPNVTMLVESGGTTQEIASLMYRQNASPRLVRAEDLMAPDPHRCRVLVTAGIRPPGAEVRARILAHAEAGASVVTDAYGKDAWWRGSPCKLARAFEDREFHTLGRGRLVAYKEEIQDPGEFAFDVLDLAGQDRALRLWDDGAIIALATAAPTGGPAQAVLCAVNYGHPIRRELLAQIHGHYPEATLLRPEAKALKLRVARRGPNSEVALPAMNLLAAVVFA
jgi:hypothetical protein